tara:strand:- start:78 stop:938 length:861 start_codon:yes stop_codon:yes gene_type:complete
MKCLVTGGSGFLGSHVAEILTKKGHKVTIYDKKKTKWLLPNQKMILGNLLNRKKLALAIKGNDFVFHFAALADLKQAMSRPHDTVNFNILGTINVLELSIKHKIKRVIFASSIYVNSEQGGFYRSSKRAAEDYIEEFNKRFGLKFTILRFGSLYGERSDLDNGVRRVIESGKHSKLIKYFGDPKSVRKYIYVKDAAKACAKILKKKHENKHLIITGKKTVPIKKLLKMVNKMYGYKKEIKFYKKRLPGHYIKNPFTYRFKKGLNYVSRDQIEFEKGLKKVFLEINK